MTKAPIKTDWRFSGDMVSTFETHIQQSIPVYQDGHDLVLKLSDFFIKPNSVCYEIGSATGILSHQLLERHPDKNVRVLGIDIEPDMVDAAKKKYQLDQLDFECHDIVTYSLDQPADLIVAYFTVQFIHPAVRQQVIDKIFQALNWGGGFIMFEKVRACDARFQDMMTQIYQDYKLDQGFQPRDILEKSAQLKGVLEPFSTQANLDLLTRAGFKDVMSVMKYVCFEGFLAIK